VLSCIHTVSAQYNPTLKELKLIFTKNIIGIDIIVDIARAREKSKKYKRFFITDHQTIQLKCGQIIAVTNQITSEKVKKFISFVQNDKLNIRVNKV